MYGEIIYGLRCEGDDLIMYVGRTIQPDKRLKEHLAKAASGHPSHVSRWIRSMTEIGKSIEIIILEECSRRDAKERERHWIGKHAYQNPDLVNTNGNPNLYRPDLAAEGMPISVGDLFAVTQE